MQLHIGAPFGSGVKISGFLQEVLLWGASFQLVSLVKFLGEGVEVRLAGFGIGAKEETLLGNEGFFDYNGLTGKTVLGWGLGGKVFFFKICFKSWKVAKLSWRIQRRWMRFRAPLLTRLRWHLIPLIPWRITHWYFRLLFSLHLSYNLCQIWYLLVLCHSLLHKILIIFFHLFIV